MSFIKHPPIYLILSSLVAGSLLHAADRPNILFILCDDLGYGDVGVFYQNQRAAQKYCSMLSPGSSRINMLV